MLIEADLLGQLRLMVFPVLLGEGKRLFPEGEAKHPPQLIEARTVGEGISLVRYGL
jgi:dihydrofolate reductase